MVDNPAARAEHDHAGYGSQGLGSKGLGSQGDASGEWKLLLSRVNGWIANADVADLWERSKRPLTVLGWLLAALIVLKVYGAVVDTIDSLPLMGGLLELVGVIWLSRFAADRLLRRSDRQQLLAGLETRWRRFRGQG